MMEQTQGGGLETRQNTGRETDAFICACLLIVAAAGLKKPPAESKQQMASEPSSSSLTHTVTHRHRPAGALPTAEHEWHINASSFHLVKTNCE